MFHGADESIRVVRTAPNDIEYVNTFDEVARVALRGVRDSGHLRWRVTGVLIGRLPDRKLGKAETLKEGT
jgi:hypothetical protein